MTKEVNGWLVDSDGHLAGFAVRLLSLIFWNTACKAAPWSAWLSPNTIIIHQTHCEKPDWSRAFNQFTIACELDMITAISAADIAFIMSSSTSAWLLSPLERSPQKQNGWTLRFCFWGWIMWKVYNKTIIEFGFRMISWIIKTSRLCYLPQPSASADNTDLTVLIIHWYHAQPHPIIVHMNVVPRSTVNTNGGTEN